tara:strand:+ start:1425 stop:1922 length:498 start_codon:yes stop_codon:yes gene_type:complete
MSAAQEAEAIIRQKLDGKFFLPCGRDRNVVRQEEKAMRSEAASTRYERQQRLMAQNAAKMELKDIPGERISARKILLAVSYAHGISIDDIIGQARHRHIIYARQHACYMMRQITKKSFPYIAERLARDHSTVQHSCRTWERLKPRFKAQVEIVNSILIDGKPIPA